MIMTKITFTSADIEFDSMYDFELYVHGLLGKERYENDLVEVITQPIIDGIMFPIEKTGWDGKSGFLQRYHKDSLDSKEFQLRLINSSIFKELYRLLKANNFDVKIDMLSSDEQDINSKNLYRINIGYSDSFDM